MIPSWAKRGQGFSRLLVSVNGGGSAKAWAHHTFVWKKRTLLFSSIHPSSAVELSNSEPQAAGQKEGDKQDKKRERETAGERLILFHSFPTPNRPNSIPV